MSNYKLARVSSNYVLADFDTKQVKVFNEAGKFLHDSIVGSPNFSSVYVISLVQVGKLGVIYDGVSERPVRLVSYALGSLMSSGSVTYPLQLVGRTQRGISYKQYIFCYSDSSVRDTVFSSL